MQLVGGVPDAMGVAELTLGAPIVIGASLPGSTPNCGDCDACWRFEQDTSAGFVACSGGFGTDVSVTIDSNGSSAPPAPAQDRTCWLVPTMVLGRRCCCSMQRDCGFLEPVRL